MRTAIPCRRRSSHRSSDGGEGPQPGRDRCPSTGKCPYPVLLLRQHSRTGSLFPGLFATGVEGAALFVVDDFHAAQISRSKSVRPATPVGRTGIYRQLERRIREPGRELRWIAPRRGGCILANLSPGLLFPGNLL